MMTLRPALASDQSALFDLHTQVFRHHIEKIWGWDDQWQLENFQSEWKTVQTEVIYCEDQLQGYLQTRLEQDHLYLLTLALLPKYQGKGAGTEIINLVKQRALSQDLPIRLSVFKTNQRAIKLYEGLGFSIDTKTDDSFKMHWQPFGGK